MRRTNRKILPVILLILFITGCSQAGAEPATFYQDEPSIEPAFPVEGTPVLKVEPSPTPPVITPKPSQSEVFEKAFMAIDCGDNYCQAQWPGLLSRPIQLPYQNTIDPTYPYASTFAGELEPHHGVEFVNSSGTPVVAAASGEVVFAGVDNETLLGPYPLFYGNVVVLHHPDLHWDGNDLFTLYAHLSTIEVDTGDFVQREQTLGQVGLSGAAIGSHLHFEVRLGENDYQRTFNPVLWFEPVLKDGGDQMATLSGIVLDPNGYTVSQFPLTLKRLGEDGEVQERYYPKTYYPFGPNGHPLLGESFTVSDIPPGEYRLALIWGRLYEVDFILEPGSLGFIKVQFD